MLPCLPVHPIGGGGGGGGLVAIETKQQCRTAISISYSNFLQPHQPFDTKKQTLQHVHAELDLRIYFPEKQKCSFLKST